MEIKMKYILGVVSLYFFVAITSAQATHQKQPLCDLRSMLTNETFYAQILNSIIHGDKGVLECIGGCFIYSIDRLLGAVLRKMLPLPYNFISNCISEGVKKKNTCSILPCLMNTASSALNVMEAMGVHIPFHINDFLKNILQHHQYNKYDVDHSADQQPPQSQQQQSYQPQQVATPPPPPPPTPAPTPKPTTPSAAYPLKSFGLLNICIAIIISKFIL